MIGRTYICLLTACLLLNVPSAFAAKILIINSYHPENIWTMNCLQGVSDTLGNQHDIEILYMNTKRKPKAEFNQIAKDTLEQAEKINPDLIMLADDNALSLLGQDLSKKDIPIVFYGINNNPRVYFKPERLPNNVFGVLERHLILPLVRHIKNIAPIKHNRILVLLDDSTTSQSIKAVGLKGDDQNIVGDTEVNAQTVRYFDDWKQHVLQAGESYDAIILQTWYTVLDRKSGQVINEKEVLDWTGKIPQFLFFLPSLMPLAMTKQSEHSCYLLMGMEKRRQTLQ